MRCCSPGETEATGQVLESCRRKWCYGVGKDRKVEGCVKEMAYEKGKRKPDDMK